MRDPFDEEWRELSGYADPATYAPVVAAEVGIAARHHVERHWRRPADPLEGDQDRPVLPPREAQWQILLGALADEGAVREVAPGRIELQDSGGTVITVVVSPDQWERVLTGPAWDDVGLHLHDLLGPRQKDEEFVVFYKGSLAPTREKLPPFRGRAFERMMAETRADDPDAQFGWYTHPPEYPGERCGA